MKTTRFIVRAMKSVCHVKVTNTDNLDDAIKALVQYMDEGYKSVVIYKMEKVNV